MSSTNIDRYRYDTDPMTYAIVGSSGSAIDITGDQLVMTIDTRPNPDDQATEQARILGAIDDGDLGYCSFTPTPEQADLEPRRYYYQIRRTEDQSGEVKTIEAGMYLIRPAIPDSALITP